VAGMVRGVEIRITKQKLSDCMNLKCLAPVHFEEFDAG